MIGCMEDAQLIQEWDDMDYLPEGWDCIGSGDERFVYTSPAGIVYKVEISITGANAKEYYNICRIELQEPVEKWRVPKASLYVIDKFHSVIAMEFIDGTDPIQCESTYSMSGICTCEQFPCVGIDWEMVGELWGIRDLHRDNVKMLPDGTNVLVDVTR